MAEENVSVIKKANTPDDIVTKEEYDRRVREIVKCKKDIVYFANTYFKILNLNTGITTIKLYPKQEELLKFFRDEKRCITLASRQSSKSTTYTIYLLWLCTFFAEKKAMILANKAATAVELLGRIQLGYEYLPAWLKSRVVVFNKTQMIFANKSEIRCFASSSDAARGFSCNCVTGDTTITVLDVEGNHYICRIDDPKVLEISRKWPDGIGKILTSKGFRNFRGIRISETDVLRTIEAHNEDGTAARRLSCTPEHRLRLSDGSFAEVKDLKIGDVLFGGWRIVMNAESHSHQLVYDVLDVEDGNAYFTNGLESHNCVILDEFAFLPKNIANKLFTSIYPVVATAQNSKIIIVSTPNGTVDNLYYELWREANSPSAKNKEGWKPFEMHWWDVPGRDEKFKEMTIASIGQKRWDQEFACEFLAPSDFRKLVPEDILEKYKMRLDQYRLQEDYFGREMQLMSEDQEKVYTFTMWECFKPNHAYLAAGDPSEGTGQDQSSLQIWDVTDLGKIELVCKFASNEVSVLEFACICKEILKLYANPPFIAENNACGAGLLDSLRLTYKYPNIVKEGTPNNRYGVRSHTANKSKGCLWLRDMVTTQGFDWIIKDSDLLKEAGSFVRKENKTGFITYAAMGNTHDDLMMTWVWTAYMLQPNIVEKYFVAVSYFTSSLGVVYPKMLAPGIDYSKEELDAVFQSDFYKEFQDTIVRNRLKKQQSDEQKLALAQKERELKAIEKRISETDYSMKPSDAAPFNPTMTREGVMGDQQGGGRNRPSFVFSDSDGWSDADFDGAVW